MHIKARIIQRPGMLETTVSTEENEKSLSLPAKPGGNGVAINGGELLFLALATCYCNDLYREAAILQYAIKGVEVHVDGSFGGPGEPATDIRYSVKIEAPDCTAAQMEELMQKTDQKAEIHNTLRKGTKVELIRI